MASVTPPGELKVTDIRQLVVDEPSVSGPNAPVDELVRRMSADARSRSLYLIDGDRPLPGGVRMDRVADCQFPLLDAVVGLG